MMMHWKVNLLDPSFINNNPVSVGNQSASENTFCRKRHIIYQYKNIIYENIFYKTFTAFNLFSYNIEITINIFYNYI